MTPLIPHALDLAREVRNLRLEIDLAPLQRAQMRMALAFSRDLEQLRPHREREAHAGPVWGTDQGSIRGHQWSSVVISGHQRPSAAISDHQ